MIVCVCNAIKEDDLRDAARRGTQCAKRAYAELGRRPKCGMCLSEARSVMAQEGVKVPRQDWEASRGEWKQSLPGDWQPAPPGEWEYAGA